MKTFSMVLAIMWTANFIMFLITKQPPTNFSIGCMYVCLILWNIIDFMKQE